MRCLACGASTLATVMELGDQPAANLLLAQSDDTFERVDLALVHCRSCGHLQQRTFFPPEQLFSHYLYRSGTSGTLARFFDWLAGAMARFLPAGASVLELACNDGSFLDALQRHGFNVCGIDPARNLVDMCRHRGLNVICNFWPTPGEQGRYDAVVALNVLAHNPAPFDFLQGVAEALTDRGIAVLQVSQADMVRNGEFDTLYHEHYSFFCPESMMALLRRVGLYPWVSVKTTVHGGSMLVVCGRSAVVSDGLEALFDGTFVDADQTFLISPDANAMADFVRKARAAADGALRIVEAARHCGCKICLVGAAAKAVTFLQFSGLKVDAVFDEAELKWGRHIPGMGLPVRPLEEVSRLDADALFVVGAWNFYDELKGKLALLRQGRSGDSLLRYFPALEMAPLVPAQGR